MRDFDPFHIASQWHSGQGSPLYAFASTGRIPNEGFKDRLVGEIEDLMAGADDNALDELEYLLMHVEKLEPERMQGMYEGQTCECGMTEAECECSMSEGEFGDWVRQTAGKVKDLAMTDVGGPEGILTPVDRVYKHGSAKKEPSNDYKKWQEKRAIKGESALHAAIVSIVAEMKLGVAGMSPYGFGNAAEVDDDDVDHFLITKKKDVPKPEESGVKAKKPKLNRKSKKTA